MAASKSPDAFCEHAGLLGMRPNPLAKIDSNSFKKNLAAATLKCDSCDYRVPKLWVCLEPSCRAIVCTTSQTSHMKVHCDTQHKELAKDKCHCVFMNPRTLTVWCYRCSLELNPFSDENIMSPSARVFLKTVARCMQGKRGKQNGDTHIQDLDLPGLVGLKNLGNTCYMNAALQALSNTPALTCYFQTCEAFIPESRRMEYARQQNQMLVDSFFHFMNYMWSGKSAIFSPAHLVSDVKKCNEAFQGYGQQDSQEFLHCLFDKLHDELTYPNASPTASTGHQRQIATSLGPSAISTTTKGSHSPSKDSAISTATLAKDPLPSLPRYQNGGTTSSASVMSTGSTGSSRSAPSSENSSVSENVEITPAKPTLPSIISDIFEGTLESRVRCLSCHKDFIKEDRFFDLSIPVDKKSKVMEDDLSDLGSARDKEGGVLGNFVEWFSKGAIKLQDCLSSFCATEELTGEDRYRCTRCDALNDCRKTFRITHLPDTLCIQLKRFRFDSYFLSKINTYVQFPMEDLDMKPYLKSTDAEQLRHTKYDLYAMVRHRGGLGGGHYVGYAKHNVDGHWYEFDDTYVTRKTAADVSKMEAYILFYKRRAPARDEERTQIMKFMSPTLMQVMDGGLMVWISRLWFCKWQHTLNPGPISNYDFLCPHDRVNVTATANVLGMVMRIPRIAWDALVEQHGTDGSPVVPIHALETDDGMACAHCEIEEQMLNERRHREDADITRIDSSVIAEGQLWYLIGADWLKEWHAFKSGAKPPGPIRNAQFLKDNGQPRLGMKRGTDYRGVNRGVWQYLHEIYGGGPECVRASLDVYAPPQSTTEQQSSTPLPTPTTTATSNSARSAQRSSKPLVMSASSKSVAVT